MNNIQTFICENIALLDFLLGTVVHLLTLLLVIITYRTLKAKSLQPKITNNTNVFDFDDDNYEICGLPTKTLSKSKKYFDKACKEHIINTKAKKVVKKAKK